MHSHPQCFFLHQRDEVGWGSFKPKIFRVHAGTFFSCPDTIIIVSLAPEDTLFSCLQPVSRCKSTSEKHKNTLGHKIAKLRVRDTLTRGSLGSVPPCTALYLESENFPRAENNF
jgi:hypothetical protein